MKQWLTLDLPATPLFAHIPERLSVAERIELSHERAKVIGLRYALTMDDILLPSRKFWDMWADPITTLDGGATALLGLQLNLAAGTLAPYAKERPELLPLMDDILTFRVSAQFLSTEVGHGLDAINLETTATMRDDGTFDLHTPRPNAAKFMPLTLPGGGVPRIGIVMARLIHKGTDKGVRPFIVALNDGKEMCKGITARQLPSRTGTKAIGHAITTFNHVSLPAYALLGEIDHSENQRDHFFKTLSRTGVGALSLSSVIAPGLKVVGYISAKYSLRRCVGGPGGKPVPIMSFRTQQLPILHSLAQGFVLEAFYNSATTWFSDTPHEDWKTRSAVSTILKAVMIGHWRRTGVNVIDRCGAQGMFDHNQMLPMELELRSVAIAEGDVLALCLRLAPELLLGRYTIPSMQDPNCRLAVHEKHLWDEMKDILRSTRDKHRSELANHLLLPRCLPLVEAIGHRMAFEAARDAGVPEPLIHLYEVGVIGADLAAYIEYGATSRRAFAVEEAGALNAVLGRLEEYLEAADVAPYCVATIVSAGSWDAFVQSLDLWSGEASYDPLPSLTKARL